MAEPLPFAGTERRGEPMRRHVTWRAGGAADRFYIPAGLEDLSRFLQALPPGEPVCFVGLGSNLLVRDGGFRGTVILMHSSHAAISWRDGELIAAAGAACPKVGRLAANHGREGAEFLAGIPGTVGGALAMNAGCYGAETWDFVRSVRTIDRSGNVKTRGPEDFDVGYRHVALCPGTPGAGEWFVEAAFRFPEGDGARARERIRDLLARRIATQPLGLPNAGSVFRNPPRDHAARLIEACGLKGFALGGARISEKHANFIVNPGGRASAEDIEKLIHHAREAVHVTFGIDLVAEVRIIGEEERARG